jgi:prepilin-type N-terminal cleavage/methylation domain-containing protein
MRNSGFSMIEMLTVIALISVLAALSTLGFNNWTVKQNVERQTKELVADINDLRLRAIHSKKRHVMILLPGSYTFKKYSSEAEAVPSTVVYSKPLKYNIKLIDGSSVAGKEIMMDERGFTNDWMTLWVDSTNDNAAFNCAKIAAGRTNIGKKKGSDCDPK